MTARSRTLIPALLLPVLLSAPTAGAEEAAAPMDVVRSLAGMDSKDLELPLRALAIVTVLSVVPAVLLLTTCFPRILIVLSFLRRALGAQDILSNQIVAGLTLLLTGVIMLPLWKRIHAEAYEPFARGEITSAGEALERAAGPVKEFLLGHTLQGDLRLLVEISRHAGGTGANAPAGVAMSPGRELPDRVEDLGFHVILPAFVLSELKTAFRMGFMILLPFLVIDLAVSAVLVSMGMFLLPPVFVSLPLKVLVFVLVDGWGLVVAQLAQSLAGKV
jgi:flagellar biosynthetic protein FliP